MLHTNHAHATIQARREDAPPCPLRPRMSNTHSGSVTRSPGESNCPPRAPHSFCSTFHADTTFSRQNDIRRTTPPQVAARSAANGHWSATNATARPRDRGGGQGCRWSAAAGPSGTGFRCAGRTLMPGRQPREPRSHTTADQRPHTLTTTRPHAQPGRAVSTDTSRHPTPRGGPAGTASSIPSWAPSCSAAPPQTPILDVREASRVAPQQCDY